MNHLLLFFLCIFSLEILKKFNFINAVNKSLALSKKVFKVVQSSSISDHWKEKIIPHYAFLLMSYSLKNLFILLIIFLNFLLFILLFKSFGSLLFSFAGIVESIIFILIYLKLKEIFLNE